MVFLSVCSPRRAGQLDLLRTQCHGLYSGSMQKQIQFDPAGLAFFGIDHQRRLEQIKRADKPLRVGDLAGQRRDLAVLNEVYLKHFLHSCKIRDPILRLGLVGLYSCKKGSNVSMQPGCLLQQS
jgi:hypothetical protein